MDHKKRPIIVRTVSLPSSDCSTLSDQHEKQAWQERSDPDLTPPATCEPAEPSVFVKSKELLAFAGGCLVTCAKDAPNRHRAASKQGDFNHYVVRPWYDYFGRNYRVTTSQALSTISLEPCDGGLKNAVINGGGFNYAGTYSMSPRYEALQRRCLDALPTAGAAAPLVERALQKAVIDFWGADCSFTTPTGYQANILALTGILDDSWCFLMDQKSHSSISTAAYLAEVGCRKRFKHNDMQDLESLLAQLEGQYTNTMVAVEGLYSLDGDMPNLAALSILKARYNFTLYCDEAHSFLSLGNSGHGCLEWWNDMHPDGAVAIDLIDIRTTTMSKAAGGGAGGLVCASKRFSEQLHARHTELGRTGESISTPAMLHTIWVLRQPRRLKRDLARLRAMSVWCREQLDRAGIYVYGERTSPILPVHAGRPTKASKLSYVLRKHGVAATPFSKPAVPMWQSRVRIGMSAEFSDEHVTELNQALIRSCTETELLRMQEQSCPTSKPHDNESRFRYQSSAEGEEHERLDALRYCYGLVRSQSDALAATGRLDKETNPHVARHTSAVIEAGHRSRTQYGLPSGSSRWILGTYPPHLQVEQAVAEMTGQPAAMTYTNTEAGLMSTVAALCRPIKRCSKNWLLVPNGAQRPVTDGFRIAPRNSGTEMVKYSGLEGLATVISSLSERPRTSYITLVLDAHQVTSATGSQLDEFTAGLQRYAKRMTILLDSTFSLPSQIPASSQASTTVQVLAEGLQARLLVFTSFYHTLGLNGACLAGDDALIEELRYTSRCYVFTAAPAPYTMSMVVEALKGRAACSETADRGS